MLLILLNPSSEEQYPADWVQSAAGLGTEIPPDFTPKSSWLFFPRLSAPLVVLPL